MVNDLLVKGAAFAAFILLLAGSTYGAYQVIHPDGLVPRGLSAQAVEDTLAVSAGSATAFAVTVRNTGEDAEDVRLRVVAAGGIEGDEPVTLTVPGSGSAAGFVDVHASPGIPAGDIPITIVAETLREPVKRAYAQVTVTVLPDGEALQEGENVRVRLVGALGDGRLFSTNVADYDAAPLPRMSYYDFSPGNVTVTTGAGSNVVEAFWKSLIGLQVGETRLVRLTSDEAFPEFVDETRPARATLERDRVLPNEVTREALSGFDEFLQQTGQGRAADYAEGDTFVQEDQVGNVYRFRVTAVTEETVSFLLDPEIGTRFTLQETPFWPNGHEVVAVNESALVFRLTPTTDVDEPFTFHAQWPDASAVVSLNDTHVVVAHRVAEGFEYEVADPAGGPPREYRVDRVEDDVIHVTYRSQNVLAGEDLMFLVRGVEIIPARDALSP